MSAYPRWRKAKANPGHILFSAPYIEARRGSVEALALAPVGGVPERQGQGVGSALTDQRAARWYEVYAGKSILGRWTQPHEMVEVVVLLFSGTSSHVMGFFVLVDGGWTAVGWCFAPLL